jgi:hypothetical protein
MHPSHRTLLLAAILLLPSVSITQQATPSTDVGLLGRLSYDKSGFAPPRSVTHVCFDVSRNGEYRIMRWLNDGHTQRLHGSLAKEEFASLSNLLQAPDFRNLSSNGGGLILQKAETIAAEIAVRGRWHDDGYGTKWLEPQTWHLQWLNADGQTPFPTPVAKVVDWLRRFAPKNAKRFEDAEFPDVCPSGGMRLVQPSISENLRP